MSVYNVFVRNFIQMQIRSKHRNIVETLGISLHSNHIANDKLMPVWLFLGYSTENGDTNIQETRNFMTQDRISEMVILIRESDAQLLVQIKNA